MAKRFYAIEYRGSDKVAVFDSQQERDEWVAYQDEFSKAFGITAEEAKEDGYERQAITHAEAFWIVGSRIDYIRGYLKDSILSNLRWVIDKPICGGVI